METRRRSVASLAIQLLRKGLWLFTVAGTLACASWAAAAAAVNAEAARDFRTDYPTDCSPQEARAIFERQLRTLRSAERAEIQRLADELEHELKRSGATPAKDETPEMLTAVHNLLAVLRSVSDAHTAMLLSLQHRSRLSKDRQAWVAAIVERLSPLVDAMAQAKLAYQPYLAQRLRRRWEPADLSERRALVREYLRLAGQEPEWLLQHSAKFPLPLTPAAAEMLDSFEHRFRDQLHTAERAFEPKRDALQTKLQTAATTTGVTEVERAAIRSIEKLLDADYGQGFRGLMLLEVDPELPVELRHEVAAFQEAFRTELADLRSERAAQLAELQQQLAPLREVHLQEAGFAELLAIDIRLNELAQLLRPLHILARREPGIDWPEEVLLLDVQGAQFRVRFLRDRRETLLPREQVLLKPSSPTLPGELAAQTPTAGPGTPLGDDIKLRPGQTLLAYHNQTWYPVTVVDESPFGVVIQWQGFRDNTLLRPRNQLRWMSER